MLARIGDVVSFRPRTSDVACVGVIVAIDDFEWPAQRLFKVWVESSGWARLEVADARIAMALVRRPAGREVTGVVLSALNRYDRFLGNARDAWGIR